MKTQIDTIYLWHTKDDFKKSEEENIKLKEYPDVEYPCLFYLFENDTYTVLPLKDLGSGEPIFIGDPEPTKDEDDARAILMLASLAKKHGVPLDVSVNVKYMEDFGEGE